MHSSACKEDGVLQTALLFEDFPLLRTGKAENDPGALFKHIRVQTAGAQKLYAVFQTGAVGHKLIVACLGFCDFLIEAAQGKVAHIAVQKVKAEVSKQPKTQG